MSDVSGVLTKKARPAWQLLALIAAIVLAMMKIIDIDHKYASAAASEVFAPTKSLVESHLQEIETSRKWMLDYATEEKADRKEIIQDLNLMKQNVSALCQANPKARCK